MSDDLVFLFSKALELPTRFFQGYCFQGVDYIEGERGAREFEANTGCKVAPGQDGCYVFVSSNHGMLEVSTDYSGNKKVFYYWSPSFWAVSNSFVSLVEHLKENLVPVQVNAHQLHAIAAGGRSSALNQLTSYSTSVAGIFLAPAMSVLTIGNKGVGLSPVKFRQATDYKNSLSEACRVWLARIKVLTSAGVYLSSDLTGGADSRAVLSMILAAGRNHDVSLGNVTIRSGSTGSDTTDLDIATEICDELGLKINLPSPIRRRRLDSAESYRAWRTLCLGAYHPIYFPRFATRSGLVSFGGGGAENHRRFYKHTSFDRLVESCANRIKHQPSLPAFAREMRASVEFLCELSDVSVDPLILHYRNFRHRFHTGRSPQHATVFSPLGSHYFECASGAAGEERINLGQIGYDIMASLAPDLLEFRFDIAEKELTSRRKELLTIVDAGGELTRGSAYLSDDTCRENEEPAAPCRPLGLLFEEVESLAKSQVISDFWGRPFIDSVVADISIAREAGRFAHAVDGQNTSALLVSGAVL